MATSTATTAQQAFYKNKQNKTGPTSASKRRGGKHKKAQENEFEITDFDKDTCHLGVLKSKFNEWSGMVTDLRNDKLIKCSTQGFNIKFVSVGSPVVFSLLSKTGSTGEMLGYFTVDYLRELSDHFGANYEKLTKLCGVATTINNVEELSDILIASPSAVSPKKIEKDSGSNSDSIERNPNHAPSSDDEDEDEQQLSEEQQEKMKNISIDYSNVADKKDKRIINKKAQTKKIQHARGQKEKFNGLGFRF